MFLPLELIPLIADELRDDRCSLSRLSQTSSPIYHLIIRTLYEDVNLVSGSLEPFCHTMKINTRQLSNHTWILKVEVGDDEFRSIPRRGLTTAQIIEFRSVLHLFPNLQELFLGLEPKGFGLCLDDLKVPFALRKLGIHDIQSKEFRSFISGQGTIGELHYYPKSESIFGRSGLGFSPNPHVLPQLNSICADYRTLCSVIPGHPVTEVIINFERAIRIYPRDLLREESWRDIYSSSTVPVTTTGFRHWHNSSSSSFDPWEHMLPALRIRRHKMQAHLKKFKIIESFEDNSRGSYESKRAALTRRVGRLLAVVDFKQLEAIEVSLADSKRPSKSKILNWLDDMSTLAAWKRRLPSLKQVSMYDVDLE